MGMYCLNLLNMALELAKENPSYQGSRDEVLRALPRYLRTP